MQTKYEKHNVQAGAEILVIGEIGFNSVNKKFKSKPTKFIRDPKPQYIVEIINPEFRGDKSLTAAISEGIYTNKDGKKAVTLYSKSPFEPLIFTADIEDGEKASACIPEGAAIAKGEAVTVHCRAFGAGIIGSSFDALKFDDDLMNIKLTETGGRLSKKSFDL